jgi:hypothetical protein
LGGEEAVDAEQARSDEQQGDHRQVVHDQQDDTFHLR